VHAPVGAVFDLAVQESHMAQRLCLSKTADFAHYPESMGMEAVPVETGSCEHICRYRREAVPKTQPVPHNLEQSSCAAVARTDGTAAVDIAAAAAGVEDIHIEYWTCGRR